MKNEKNFVTHLVALGHLSFYMPQAIGSQLKMFVQNLVKDLFVNPNADEVLNRSKTSLKLAGKWCDNEDDLPFETRAQIEAIKLITRWCLGLKGESSSTASSIKLLARIIVEQGDTNSSKTKMEPEKSRIRLTSGTQLLKFAQESCFRSFINAEYFHIIAKLMIVSF